MSSAPLPWWAWFVAAAVLWLVALFMDEDDHPFARFVVFLAMVFSAVAGVVRLVKWVWNW